MGFAGDQEGILQRYLYEAANWQPHLLNTKRYIEEFVSVTCPENVAVLGSGWLLDVPLDFLARQCRQVYLFDIRHPRQVVHKYKKTNNVHFVTQDITGGLIEQVYRIMSGKPQMFEALNQLSSPGFSTFEPIDSVISVNVLNQLDVLITEYLRRFKLPQSFNALNFRSNIQAAHLLSLPVGGSCLVTDVEEKVFNASHEPIETNPLIFVPLPDGKNHREWLWMFDTQMTYYENRITYFKVIAKYL